MKAINEKKLVLIRETQLANKLIRDVDNPDVSDESFNKDLLKLCQLNQLSESKKDYSRNFKPNKRETNN